MKPSRIRFAWLVIVLLVVSLSSTSCQLPFVSDGFSDYDESDFDADDIANAVDNCINTHNSDQKDSDNDGIGDACDFGSQSSNPPEDSSTVPEPPAPCPQTPVHAAMLPSGQLALWESDSTVQTTLAAGGAVIVPPDQEPIPGTIETEPGAGQAIFTEDSEDEAIREGDDGMSFHETWILGAEEFEKKYGVNPMDDPEACERILKRLNNPANLSPYAADIFDDVFQHTDTSQPATNAQASDDILAVIPWYNGYPLTPETRSSISNGFAGDANPYLLQLFGDMKLNYGFDDSWYPGKDGMPVPPRTLTESFQGLGPTPAQLEFQKAVNLLLMYSAWPFPAGNSSQSTAPLHVLARPARQSAGATHQGFQFFAPGAWTAGPVTVSGENFAIKFMGAWSGAAFDSANGELGVWTSNGPVEISGNGKTVTLQGLGDGRNIALSVIAADGTPSDAQTVMPAELGQRFGAYTAAMPQTLTFEIFLAGPFASAEISQEMMDGLAWQVLLDIDGDPATGATRDFLAAQGLGFEIFFHSEGKTAECSGRTSTGENFDCPKDLFSVTYDPAGRVVMSAPLAELQSIAEQAGVAFDPAKMKWRVSHINHMLEGNPQDVFPNP